MFTIQCLYTCYIKLKVLLKCRLIYCLLNRVSTGNMLVIEPRLLTEEKYFHEVIYMMHILSWSTGMRINSSHGGYTELSPLINCKCRQITQLWSHRVSIQTVVVVLYMSTVMMYLAMTTLVGMEDRSTIAGCLILMNFMIVMVSPYLQRRSYVEEILGSSNAYRCSAVQCSAGRSSVGYGGSSGKRSAKTYALHTT